MYLAPVKQIAALLCVALPFVCTNRSLAEMENGVPQAVLDTINAIIGDQAAVVEGIEKEQWGNVDAYEYGWTTDGQQREVIVSSHGDLLAMETALNPTGIPLAVLHTASEMGWSTFKAERIELIVYELEQEETGDEVVVLPWGQIVADSWLNGGVGTAAPDTDQEFEVDDDDDDHEDIELALQDLPAKVLATVERVLPGIELLEAELERGPNGTTRYELEGRSGGDLYELAIQADGKLLGVELDTDEAIDDND